MSNSEKSTAQPAIIVFGVSAIGKPRAGTFKNTDVSAARKAATKLGLSVIEIADPAGQALAAKISTGKIGASADGIVPFVSKDIYEQIKALASPQRQNGRAEAAATTVASPMIPFRLPENWDDIRVGDQVLAHDTDPADGWLHARVTQAHGDLLRLSWPRGGLFQTHRAMLGLMCPGEIKEPVKTDPKQAAAKPAVYPAHWSVIGVNQIVLAQDDSPIESWWPAKTIKLDKDVFTLEWRDHPQLPPIVRPRSALGLVHPAPKAR